MSDRGVYFIYGNLSHDGRRVFINLRDVTTMTETAEGKTHIDFGDGCSTIELSSPIDHLQDQMWKLGLCTKKNTSIK